MKKMLAIIAIIAIVIIAIMAINVSNVGEEVGGQETSPVSLNIEGPTSIEVGEAVEYSVILSGQVCMTDLPETTWKVLEGKIISQNGNTVSIEKQSPGQMEILVSFGELSAQKVVQVYSRATVSISMSEAWIHPGNWYFTGIGFSGATEPDIKVFQVLETGRTVPVLDGWEVFSYEEIMFQETGNYLLVVEGKALSDGRTVSAQKELTVTPYIQQGYYTLSWSREGLVQLTPADKVAIEFFLREMGIETQTEEGNPKTVNRLLQADYVFYKDSSREDALLYQTGVSISGEVSREMVFNSIKGEDGRYWYICEDAMVVSVKRGSPAASFISSSGGDDGGSSSSLIGGGGTGPSPRPSV